MRLWQEGAAQNQVDRDRCAATGISPSDCPQSALALKDVLTYRACEDATMTCDKYPDGTYIPAFGNSRLTPQANSTLTVRGAAPVSQTQGPAFGPYDPTQTSLTKVVLAGRTGVVARGAPHVQVLDSTGKYIVATTEYGPGDEPVFGTCRRAITLQYRSD